MSEDNSCSLDDGKQPKGQRNWWKIGFFVSLLVFELTREMLVIEAAAGATPNSLFQIYNGDNLVSVTGSWKRIDGGGKMMPAVVTIECWKARGECLEASANIIDRHVFAPQMEWFDAKFAPDAVTYENDIPACAKYAVRIDFRLNKVLAVRERKEAVGNPMCANLEKRIELQLGDGYNPESEPLDGHFVPLLSGILAVTKAF